MGSCKNTRVAGKPRRTPAKMEKPIIVLNEHLPTETRSKVLPNLHLPMLFVWNKAPCCRNEQASDSFFNKCTDYRHTENMTSGTPVNKPFKDISTQWLKMHICWFSGQSPAVVENNNFKNMF